VIFEKTERKTGSNERPSNREFIAHHKGKMSQGWEPAMMRFTYDDGGKKNSTTGRGNVFLGVKGGVGAKKKEGTHKKKQARD